MVAIIIGLALVLYVDKVVEIIIGLVLVLYVGKVVEIIIGLVLVLSVETMAREIKYNKGFRYSKYSI